MLIMKKKILLAIVITFIMVCLLLGSTAYVTAQTPTGIYLDNTNFHCLPYALRWKQKGNPRYWTTTTDHVVSIYVHLRAFFDGSGHFEY
jgi:hypothetical protein